MTLTTKHPLLSLAAIMLIYSTVDWMADVLGSLL